MKLVLLPGLDGTGLLFEPLLRALPSHLSPVIISYPPEQSLSYEELVQFVKQRVPSDEDYVLLAESFSGPVAMGIAAMPAKNLKALVLCSTFVSSPVFAPRIMRFLLRSSVFAFDPPRFVVSRYLMGDKPPMDLINLFRKAKRKVRPSVLAFRARSVMNLDVRDTFAACALPVLYLVARQDRLVKRGSLAEMQEIIPDMTIVEIEGPHFLLQCQPSKCVKAIDHYLRYVL